MNSASSTLEAIIRESGEGWLIDWFSPPEQAISHLRQTLDLIDRCGRERLGMDAPDLSEAAIIREFQRRPQTVRGFFQVMGGTRSPEMLLMAWRIIEGMEIKDIQLSYHRQKAFEVRVVLEATSGEEDPPYYSTNINDFALFRHIGLLEIGNRPVFDGFYALNVSET